MGMEKTDFFWYLRKMSFPALAGFFAGAAFYLGAQAVHIPQLIAGLPGV